MIRFTFWHNATAMLEIGGQRILTDPWLVPDCPPFMGAWQHWPPLPDDIIERVGDCEVIWISHCHEDHYHLPTLRAYMRRWGSKPICTRTMQNQAKADGFELGVIENAITLVASNGIDSALAVTDGEHSIVNLTDVHYEQDMIDKILRWCNGSPTIALLPFAGAGPWPQTYYSDPEVLAAKTEEKRAMFVERYLRFRDALGAKVNIPFAGQYALRGRLAHLNKWRGMNDAVDMPEPRVVLEMGGTAKWDTGLWTDGQRTSRLPYPHGEFDFENDAPVDSAELRSLLNDAWDNCQPAPCTLSFLWDGDTWTGYGPDGVGMDISIDARLLLRLVTGKTHWADADAGSHYRCWRSPDEYRKDVMDWLWNFRA